MHSHGMISVVIFLKLGLTGCRPPDTPRRALGIDFRNADRPMMLSVGPAKGGIRVQVYERQVESNIKEWAGSMSPVSETLTARIGRDARWVQIESAEYTAVDWMVNPPLFGNRKVSLIARVHPLPITDALTAGMDRNDQHVRIVSTEHAGKDSSSNREVSAKARVHP